MAENKKAMEQDIRIIQLAKWQIPKTKSVMKYQKESTFLSIGYFDMADIWEVSREEGVHPLLAAYNVSHRHPKHEQKTEKNAPLLEDYTTQELIIFTNADEREFGGDRIDSFWKNDSPILFVSLIHIDNGSCISDIIERIRECFKGRQYLYYFSFDYSGIVLFAKEMKLSEYLKLMFLLNYENKDGKKLIRDSYSFYGFNKKKLQTYFERFDVTTDFNEVFDADILRYNEELSASVNIGIQNYEQYRNFIEEVRKVNSDVEEYGLFGRHDVSLVNEKADLRWLIYIQYMIDKYTSSRPGESNEYLLSTHETFVKVPDIGAFQDAKCEEDPSYNRAKERLDSLCERFMNAPNRERYNGEYGIPVQAVKFSILSILKNRFAEDFVLSMYQSFCEFLVYLTEKMYHENDDVMEFDKCFSNYFRGLNSLVNSAMHSERQFIQATAFNAIIYDVPAKIMAFYVAVIDDLQQLLISGGDMRYTFLLTPSFSNEISVKIISYSGEKPPHDRILMVSINERSLYNPGAVVRRMAHEVAHFVGDELRNRALRKKCIRRSVIFIILSHLMHGGFLDTDDLFELIDGIDGRISAQRKFSDEEENYSEALYAVMPDLAQEFLRNEEVNERIYEHIRKLLYWYLGEGSNQIRYADEKREALREYILSVAAWNRGLPEAVIGDNFTGKIFSETEIQFLARLICQDIEKESWYISRAGLLGSRSVDHSVIARIGSGILNEVLVDRYVKMLIDTYSEAFADIQMVLLTGISYEGYLEGFIIEEGLEPEELSIRMEDISRISMVTLALQFTGIWGCEKEETLFLKNSQEIRDKLLALKRKIEEPIAILKEMISEKGKELLAPYCGIASKYAKNMCDREELWSLEGESPVYTDNISFYINENLLIYLVECIGKSIEQYKKPEKQDEIKKLRKTVDTVSQFGNVAEVYSAISGEIEKYKEKLFEKGRC